MRTFKLEYAIEVEVNAETEEEAIEKGFQMFQNTTLEPYVSKIEYDSEYDD